MLHSKLTRNFASVILPKNSNQAKGLAEFAIDFIKMDPKRINDEVYDRVRLFHIDSVICGASAIALKTNAPNILRDEAINRFSVNPDRR
jgi:2-methylcitrate dehydratase